MTQTPASGPFGPVTTPPMSSLSIWTAACCAPAGTGTATAIAAMPIAPTVENRTCRRLNLALPAMPGLSRPLSSNDIPDCITQKTESDEQAIASRCVVHSPSGAERHPGRRQDQAGNGSTNPLPTGSATCTKTIGTVLVARAAEQQYELAPPHHSMTSSARASSVGEVSRPSALATVRLKTSSNLVGCSTGRLLGLAPRRILST
jgi:hypothetical protein